MNYKEIIFLTSALLGFITIFLIGKRYRNNRQTNVYLVIIFATSSIRLLFKGLVDFSFAVNYLRQLDLFVFVSTSPFVYLYFKKLVHPINSSKRNDYLHLIIPTLLFLIINYIVTKYPETLALKMRMIVLILFNLFYVVKSYFLLIKFVWKRSSEIIMINKQNILVKKWTYILFSFYILIIGRFIIHLVTNKNGYWYQHNNDFLWITALFWIALYLKVLYSPEFLYGYDLFQNKIKEYKKHKIVFDNIWILKPIQTITNIQDNALKEKINPEIENYIIQIEHLALNTNLYLSEAFKTQDLSNKLIIPKSHLVYIFKYHSKISFNDFKKIIRIQKGITLIETGFLKENTLESLANESGFSSYSAFFKSFKSITGVSPKVYYSTNKSVDYVK